MGQARGASWRFPCGLAPSWTGRVPSPHGTGRQTYAARSKQYVLRTPRPTLLVAALEHETGRRRDNGRQPLLDTPRQRPAVHRRIRPSRANCFDLFCYYESTETTCSKAVRRPPGDRRSDNSSGSHHWRKARAGSSSKQTAACVHRLRPSQILETEELPAGFSRRTRSPRHSRPSTETGAT